MVSLLVLVADRLPGPSPYVLDSGELGLKLCDAGALRGVVFSKVASRVLPTVVAR